MLVNLKIEEVSARIIECRQQAAKERATVVGISGIDASGKGHVAKKVVTELEFAGYRVALINVDAWLNLPKVRFAGTDQACHFYKHALRLGEMFERLVIPLKRKREINLTIDAVAETSTAFRSFTYDYSNIDIILLEGIFIFKRELVRHFDFKVWIECSFGTALRRAIARGQEGLSPASTIEAYQTIYFPAQQLHFDIDQPSENADLIYKNE